MNRATSFLFLIAITLYFYFGTTESSDKQNAKQPNIVFILMDDVGWNEFCLSLNSVVPK